MEHNGGEGGVIAEEQKVTRCDALNDTEWTLVWGNQLLGRRKHRDSRPAGGKEITVPRPGRDR